jgi:hypothetical protein
MEDLFKSLGEILKPVDPNNPFNIDYSVYVDCEILSVYATSIKVRELATDKVAYISINYILYTTMGIGDIVRCNKDLLSYYP